MTAKPRDISSKSCNVTIARWSRDCISLRTNTGADYISAHTNMEDVAAKKKKNIEKTIKMPQLLMCNWTSSRDVCAYHTLVAFSCVTRYWRAARIETKAVSWIWINATGPGTHWIAYAKRNNRVYFDSFDNLRSLKELVRYFGNDAMTIEYNRILSDVRSKLLWIDVPTVSTNGRRAWI